MSITLANLAIKSDSTEDVVNYLKAIKPADFKEKIYVSESAGGNVCVFTPNESVNFVAGLVLNLSEKFNTVGIYGEVIESSSVSLGFYVNGALVYSYVYYTHGGDLKPKSTGSFADVLKTLNLEVPAGLEKTILNIHEQSSPYAENIYEYFLLTATFPYFMRNCGHNYISGWLRDRSLSTFNKNPEHLKLVVV